MTKSSKIITSDQFSWSQHPIANQLIYTITTANDSIVAGGQFLSAAKIDTSSGELLWSHPGTAFRTTEIIHDSSSIKTGGQYSNYTWEELDRAGSLNSKIPKYASEVYGHKAFFDKQDFWEIYSTTPNGLEAEYFEFHTRKNNTLQTTNTTNNFNPLAIAYNKDNSELYLAGWEGFEQHQAQIYKLDLNTSLPTLNPLPAATITSPNLAKGDQLIINEMRWDQKQKKLVFVGDAHSYNGNTKLDYGILGSYESIKGLNLKYYPFNGFIGDGSVESLQTLDELSNDYYLIGGSDSTSANTTLGKIIIADKSDLSIKEAISIDIQNNTFDHIRDVLIDENSTIYIGGSGGVHKLGKSSEIFDLLKENYITFKPEKFNRRLADKITNFNPLTDTLKIDTESFSLDRSATFAAGKNKKTVKKNLQSKILNSSMTRRKVGFTSMKMEQIKALVIVASLPSSKALPT